MDKITAIGRIKPFIQLYGIHLRFWKILRRIECRPKLSNSPFPQLGNMKDRHRKTMNGIDLSILDYGHPKEDFGY